MLSISTGPASLCFAQAMVLNEILDVKDLLAVGSVCRAWRDLVRTGMWPHVRRIVLKSYTEHLPGAVRWVAAHCRGIQEARPL